MNLFGKLTINFLLVSSFVFFSKDSIAQFESNRLSQAVDNTSFDFLTESPPVFSQKNIYNFDHDSVQMGDVEDDGVTLLSTFVPSASNVVFDWKVSSENGFDFLALVVLDSNLEQTGITRQVSGERDWNTVDVEIPSGGHWAVWGYIKDGSISSGLDTGWLDNIRIGNSGNETSISSPEQLKPTVTLPAIISLILEDSIPEMFDVSSPTVKEGQNLTFDIVLNDAVEEIIQIICTPNNGTALAGIDYDWSYNFDVFPIELNSVNLSFAPGETIKSITIPTYTWNERYYENRNFQLRCQQVGTSEFSTGNGTIIYKPNIKFSDNIPYPLTTNEGDLINLDVVVEGAILNETNVNYSISSDEAIDGVDFIDETGGSISFLPGENLKTISIRALDNGVGNRAKSIQVTLGPLTTNVDDVDILHSFNQDILILDIEPDYFPSVDISDLTPAISAISERGPHVNIQGVGGEQISQGFNYIYNQLNSNIEIIRYDDEIEIQIQGNSQSSISDESWSITMGAGTGDINVGAYLRAYSFPNYSANENKLYIRGPDYNSCSSAGSYRIYEYQQVSGVVTKLSADFEMTCDGSTKPLYGSIKYDISLPNANFPPLPAPITLPFPTLPELSSSGTAVEIEGALGDWITLGESYSYNNSTANFAYESISNNTGIRLNIDPIFDSSSGWSIALQRPQHNIYDLNNGRLAVGVYEQVSRYPFNTLNPGLSFSALGRACNQLSGRFTVYEISYNLFGNIERLTADFEQSCDFAPASKGSIKYIR